MKPLTVRGVDETLNEALEREAERRNLSVNRTVLALLRASFGLAENGAPPPMTYRDLDRLSGTWSDEEYGEFRKELHEQRSVDEDMWQ